MASPLYRGRETRLLLRQTKLVQLQFGDMVLQMLLRGPPFPVGSVFHFIISYDYQSLGAIFKPKMLLTTTSL